MRRQSLTVLRYFGTTVVRKFVVWAFRKPPNFAVRLLYCDFCFYCKFTDVPEHSKRGRAENRQYCAECA